MVNIKSVDNSPTTEVKLLKDNNWKIIQQNTFTRWVNQQLKQATDTLQIGNLATDFADGIILIKLSEVLSNRKIPRYNKKPVMRTQKLDNISLVLNFLQKEEGIKIVNIDSTHIADQNLKLILGLVWTLILHYSLSHRVFGQNNGDTEANGKEDIKKESPKQRLLAWILSKLPHHPINNFTSAWNDGIALGALVDACLDDHFDEWQHWSPDNALENTQKAMLAAEQALGVETLITPEELTNPSVDEKSVMTYLAQFTRAKPQELGKLVDLDRHLLVGVPCTFGVHFQNFMLRPDVDVMNPRGELIMADINKSIYSDQEEKPNYDVTFMPHLVGEHKINLFAASTHNFVPLHLPIETASVTAIPAPEVVALGRVAIADVARRFQVINVSDHHKLDVTAIDPDRKEIVLDVGSERDEDSVTCSYTPRVFGMHNVNVLYNKKHIPGSPFTLDVSERIECPVLQQQQETIEQQPDEPSPSSSITSPTSNYENVRVWGRGLLSRGMGACEDLYIHVDNCANPVEVAVTKEGTSIPVQSVDNKLLQPFEHKFLRQSFVYTPRASGRYDVAITTGGTHLGKSPYKINVGPKNLSSIRAVGPGLEGGVADKKAIFYVDTHGRANYLEFSIEGPSETEILCIDKGDGTALVEYTPHNTGRYVINITELDTNTHIKDSPFVLWIDPSYSIPHPDAERPVQVPLTPLNGKFKCQVGEQFEFFIPKNAKDMTNLNVAVYDPTLNNIPLEDRVDLQSHIFSFTPQLEGKHIVSIVTDKLAVDGWPYELTVAGPIDVSRIWMHGPGLAPTVQAAQKTNFIIDARRVATKLKDVEVEIIKPDGQIMHPEVDLRDPGLYNVRYEPKQQGVYRLAVYVNGKNVYNVPVHAIEFHESEEDVAAAKTHLLNYTPEMGEVRNPQAFMDTGMGWRQTFQMASEIPETVAGLNTAVLFHSRGQSISSIIASDAELHAIVKTPSGLLCQDLKLERLSDEGHYRLSFLPNQKGLYAMEITNIDGQEIEGSPFKIPVGLLGTQQAHLAWANGPGLAVGVVGRTNVFTVWNANELGAGEMSVSVDGPSNAELSTREDPAKNCYYVEYTVETPGLYTFDILFNDAPISGSPYKVFVKPAPTESLSKSIPTSPENGKPFDYLQMSTNYRPVQIEFQDSSPQADQNYNSPTTIMVKAEKQQQLPFSSRPEYSGDANLVQAHGEGLNEFVPHKTTEFLIDTSATGLNTLFVGVITSHGPTDELNVRHTGNGKYAVNYTVNHSSDAMIFVKYGEVQITGSPFHVQPATSEQ